MITVYGVPGWGSTISELMLSLADIPYEVVDVEGFDQPGPARERLRQINPLCQVPTLRLADGSIMTETAAIALMILDQRPDLAPAPGTLQRPQFQRLLVWLVANVYPTFTYADYRNAGRPPPRSSWWRIVASTGKISISGSNSSWPPGRGRWARR